MNSTAFTAQFLLTSRNQPSSTLGDCGFHRTIAAFIRGLHHSCTYPPPFVLLRRWVSKTGCSQCTHTLVLTESSFGGVFSKPLSALGVMGFIDCNAAFIRGLHHSCTYPPPFVLLRRWVANTGCSHCTHILVL